MSAEVRGAGEQPGRPQPGWLYRHFKGGLYQIVGVAAHSETDEELVIYQALYGDYRLYARPLAMFAERCPQADGQPRFQRVSREELRREAAQTAAAERQPQQTERETESGAQRQGGRELILEFLDLRRAAERIELLQGRKDELTEEMLDTMAAALDVQIEGRSAEEKYYDLLRCLEAVARFETGRMR